MAASLPDPPFGCSITGSSRSPLRGSIRTFAVAFALVVAWTPSLVAQEPTRPRLEGRVVLGFDSVAPARATAVLHLVTPETAGEVDSTRTDASGAFRFDLPTVPDTAAGSDVYVASVSYQGILYFGVAVSSLAQLETPYLITVHDTTVAPFDGSAMPIVMRYIVLEVLDGVWTVTDLFQIENPGVTTIVAPERGSSWSYPLPPGASDLEVGSGDARPDAVDLDQGSLRVRAPITPGLKQYLVRYRLPGPRLEVPLPGQVAQVELLVREPAPPLRVDGLLANQPVEMEAGVIYQRYSALSLLDGQALVVPGSPPARLPMEWLAVTLAILLALGALWAVQRTPGPLPVPPGSPIAADPVGLRERLLLDTARLDERLERSTLSDAERTLLLSERQALLERIRGVG